MKNDRIIRALLRQPVDRTPVWMMRQAGRYLPEYRQLRKRIPNFMEFCKVPEFACEVTLQPLRRFDVDAAIIFSDILTVVEALGFDLEIVSGVGPVIHNPVRAQSDFEKVNLNQAAEKLQYVYDAIALTKRELNNSVPLIGFAGSPWTVACYMVEGKNQNQFQSIRAMVYKAPDLLHRLLNLLADLSIVYINRQIEAGADIIMLFDTWGGLLSSQAYIDFSLNYMKKIGEKIYRQYNNRKIPLIFFTKNGGLWLEAIASAGCDAVGLDWTIDIGQARKRIGDKVALQGNLDPAILLSTPGAIQKEVERIMYSYGKGSGHVFNLGHGIDKSTPIENVHAMMDAIKSEVAEKC